MRLWISWIAIVWQLRIAFRNRNSFLWSVVILASFSIRSEIVGVTSFVRGHWLVPSCYRGLLRAFHSKAVDLSGLRRAWTSVALKIFSPFLVRQGDRIVLVADGLKNPKEGRRMPAVKLCHQESSNNSKAEYVMAHSCQAIMLLVRSIGKCFAVPLSCRIHEGVVFTNRDHRTLMDKLLALIDELRVEPKFVLLADAFYACGKMALAMLSSGNHLVTRVRSTAVAYYPFIQSGPRGRGRPRIYGKKVRLRSLFQKLEEFVAIPSPVYDEKDVMIQVLTLELVWRPMGRLVRFVWVIHPTRGKWLLLCTDLTMTATQIIELYGLRFKIEVAFKQSVHLIGAFAYHFWMKSMTRLRRGTGKQYLHRASENYRQGVRRKIAAYEVYMQLGLIAQGLLQHLAVRFPQEIWKSFTGWMRTMNKKSCPSERIVGQVLQQSLPEYLRALPNNDILAKFLVGKIDWTRCPAYQLTG